jgi:hypothetical protein
VSWAASLRSRGRSRGNPTRVGCPLFGRQCPLIATSPAPPAESRPPIGPSRLSQTRSDDSRQSGPKTAVSPRAEKPEEQSDRFQPCPTICSGRAAPTANGPSSATLGTFYRGVTFDACMCTISQEPFSLLNTIVRLPVEIPERLNSNVIMAVSPNRCSRTFSG